MTRRGNEGLRLPEPALEEAVQRRLDEVESGLEKAVRSDAAFVTETAGHLLAAGGKRFRPMLVILSSHLGDPSDARLVPLAVAVELTHLATLYHDDVIDEADHRRGIDSVNARWGNTVAILAGDYLFARAADLAADLGTEVSKILARTIATLCEGQIQEVRAAGRLDESAQEYMAIIRNKTAALLAASCRLGGTLSDADP